MYKSSPLSTIPLVIPEYIWIVLTIICIYGIVHHLLQSTLGRVQSFCSSSYYLHLFWFVHTRYPSRRSKQGETWNEVRRANPCYLICRAQCHTELSGCITTLTVRNTEVANFCPLLDHDGTIYESPAWWCPSTFLMSFSLSLSFFFFFFLLLPPRGACILSNLVVCHSICLSVC